MTNFVPVDLVLQAVTDANSRFASVTFVKADGTERTVTGLFKPVSKIVGSERGVAQGEAMKARQQVPIFETATEQWKSFYADRVVGIKFNGQTLSQ